MRCREKTYFAARDGFFDISESMNRDDDCQ